MTTEQVQNVLSIVGALVPLMSALASFLNHIVRQKQERGEEVSKMLLNSGAVLNVGAVNLDKALQLAKLAKKGAKEVTDEG